MKKFLAILVLGLFLITPSWADDIRDFQLGGISLGDSLLDYMSKKEIINYDQKHYDLNGKFFETQHPKSTDVYEYLLFHIKRNDPNYIIHVIRGVNKVDGKNECLKIKKKIVKEMKTLFNESKFQEGSIKHYYYKNSTQYISQFDFKNLDYAKIECMIMHDKDLKIHGDISDTLEVSMTLAEFRKWMDSL